MTVAQKLDQTQAKGFRVEPVPADVIKEGMADPGDRWIVGGPHDEVVATVHPSKVFAGETALLIAMALSSAPMLPAGQDVIEPPDLLAWKSGPLPILELEHVACLLFTFRYPEISLDNSLMTAERDDCRRFALQIRGPLLKLDRWHASNAAEKLSEQLAFALFGDRRLGPTIRKEVDDFAETVVSDACIAFRNRLFWPKDVATNQAEIDAEDAK